MRKLLIFIVLVWILGYGYQQFTSKKVEAKFKDSLESLHSNMASPTPSPKKNKAIASWYDRSACGEKIYGVDCKTANGEVFDDTKYTTACSGDFQLGSHFNICYLDKCLEIVCTDRGGFEPLGRKFDLSRSAFNYLANLDTGLIQISWELIY